MQTVMYVATLSQGKNLLCKLYNNIQGNVSGL